VLDFNLLKVFIYTLRSDVLLQNDPLYQDLCLLLHLHHAMQVVSEIAVLLLEQLELIARQQFQISDLAEQLLVCLIPISFGGVREVRLLWPYIRLSNKLRLAHYAAFHLRHGPYFCARSFRPTSELRRPQRRVLRRVLRARALGESSLLICGSQSLESLLKLACDEEHRLGGFLGLLQERLWNFQALSPLCHLPQVALCLW